MKMLIFGSGVMLVMSFTPWPDELFVWFVKGIVFLIGLGIAINGLVTKE